MLPPDLIETSWFWEILQQFGRFVPHSQSFGDWCWEQSELTADRRAARMLASSEFSAFIGTEHQCLASLEAAHTVGKPGVVVFTSPHHSAYKRWVIPEFDYCPELRSPITDLLQTRAKRRDARRDAEMHRADYLLCNSGFTARTLIEAGVPAERTIAVPLGCPVTSEPAPRAPSQAVRFLYSGRVAVNKGTRYLLEAWRRFGAAAGVELHLCGDVLLPKTMLDGLPDNVHFHGHVSAGELQQAYDQADFLVFPTLCDGFGLVVCEALARGVPVIATTNAGAADLIKPGKNGLVVPPADVDALIEAMEWVVAHRQQLPEMRRAAWESARDWSWEHFREEVARQLNEKLFSASTPALSAP